MLNFVVLGDPAFGVIWLHWALLWSLFFLLLTGRWEQVNAAMVVLLVVVGLGYVLLYPRFTRAERSEVLAHA